MEMEKAKLAESCWGLLAHHAPSQITLQAIADECEVPLSQVIIYGGDVTDLILYHLDVLDTKALATSAADFAEDPHATIYEKLLEGLMMRFEALGAYRAQFDHLHHSAKTNPLLGMHCLHQLSHVVGKLLLLAGDETTGGRKNARIAGIVGVLLRVRGVWSNDESEGLGLTMKALDDELKKACEWAVSLRVLSKSDIDATAHGDDNRS